MALKPPVGCYGSLHTEHPKQEHLDSYNCQLGLDTLPHRTALSPHRNCSSPGTMQSTSNPPSTETSPKGTCQAAYWLPQ